MNLCAVPPSMGMMRVGCNKTFVFSSELATVEKAERICCKMGMRLLSIDTKEEMACIVNIFRGNGLYSIQVTENKYVFQVLYLF
jgi:hypothetical protein